MLSCEIYKIFKDTFLYRIATVAASEVWLVFSNESGTKTNATVSNTYRIYLKKVFIVAKIQKQLLQVFCKGRPKALLERAPVLQKFLITPV